MFNLRLPANSVQSEDDSSDEEKQKEIDKRKEEEAKNKAKSESKLPSGASSKGTNTPSGRPKHTDPLKKSKSTLKRAGSPNLSESSGNESSRKKLKKKHHTSPGTSGTSTPVPGSRPMSPAPSGQARKSSVIKLNVNPSKLSEIQNAPPNPSPVYGGSMSDGEATGGEMSDGGKKKKIKLRIGSPSGSRAGSPAPGRAASAGVGSRAGSPAAQGQSMGSISPSSLLFLTGGFTGNASKYGFTEQWFQQKRPHSPESIDIRSTFSTKVASVHMKLAIRQLLPQWSQAPQSMSFVEWLRSIIFTKPFVNNMDLLLRIQRENPLLFKNSLTMPYSLPEQTHPLLSTRYLSSLHKYLLTKSPSFKAQQNKPPHNPPV